MALLSTIGRSISGMSGRSMVGLGVASFGLGMANTAGPAARDAAFEATLGTPDADQYFTGRKFSARFLASGALPGPLGSAVRATAPSDMLAVNPPMPVNPTISGAGGMGVGGVIGGIIGRGRGAAIGAAIGGTMGAAAPMAGALSYTRHHRDFFTQSPYGRSSSANAELSAVGDIVLGMHNSRRGY